MATAKKSAAARKPAKTQATDNPIDAFMDQLEHPLKSEMAAVLALFRGSGANIGEGIKWNAPSFRVDEYFATVNIRSRDAVQIILHLGAKVRHDIDAQLAIDDADGLLQWLAKDRASVKFHDMKAVRKNAAAFQRIIRQWITFL